MRSKLDRWSKTNWNKNRVQKTNCSSVVGEMMDEKFLFTKRCQNVIIKASLHAENEVNSQRVSNENESVGRNAINIDTETNEPTNSDSSRSIGKE